MRYCSHYCCGFSVLFLCCDRPITPFNSFTKLLYCVCVVHPPLVERNVISRTAHTSYVSRSENGRRHPLHIGTGRCACARSSGAIDRWRRGTCSGTYTTHAEERRDGRAKWVKADGRGVLSSRAPAPLPHARPTPRRVCASVRTRTNGPGAAPGNYIDAPRDSRSSYPGVPSPSTKVRGRERSSPPAVTMVIDLRPRRISPCYDPGNRLSFIGELWFGHIVAVVYWHPRRRRPILRLSDRDARGLVDSAIRIRARYSNTGRQVFFLLAYRFNRLYSGTRCFRRPRDTIIPLDKKVIRPRRIFIGLLSNDLFPSR